MHHIRRGGLIALAAVPLALAGCSQQQVHAAVNDAVAEVHSAIQSTAPPSGAIRGGEVAALATVDDGQFTEHLTSLTIAPKDFSKKYDRDDQFGDWKSATDYGWPGRYDECSTRDAVLLRDGEPGTHKVADGSDACADVAGSWTDEYGDPQNPDTPGGPLEPYLTSSDPGDFDIEHIVPLGEAWVSGAQGWAQEERYQLANDLM